MASEIKKGSIVYINNGSKATVESILYSYHPFSNIPPDIEEIRVIVDSQQSELKCYSKKDLGEKVFFSMEEYVEHEMLYVNDFEDISEIVDKHMDNRCSEVVYSAGDKMIQLVMNGVALKSFVGFRETCKKIVGFYLSHKDISDAIEWISAIEAADDKFRGKMSAIVNPLKEIYKIKGSYKIEDIKDTEILKNIAELHKDLEAYEKALSVYERCLELEPYNMILLNTMGGLCKKANWHDKAAKYYKQTLNIEPNNKAALTGLGAVYRAEERYQDAINCYLKALENNDLDSFANNGIGAVYFDLGEYSKGEFHFQVTGDTGFLLSQYKSFKKENKDELAIKCLELILKIEPSNKEAKKLLIDNKK